MAIIADVLTEDDRGKHILTKVLSMAHDDYNQDNRLVSIQVKHKFLEKKNTYLNQKLLAQMAHCFG